MSGKTILKAKKSMYTENDNLDREQINEYMKLPVEELERLIAEKEKEILKTPETMNEPLKAAILTENQKSKCIIELPRIPENAWLFEKRFKSKPAEHKKNDKLEDKEKKDKDR